VRGNHRFWGRQDYTEPAPLPNEQHQQVASVTVVPVDGKKTWRAVIRGECLVGYVTTRIAGQYYRTPTMTDWLFVVGDWNRADPPHGHAIAALLRHVSESERSSVSMKHKVG
jgi:hypothetical protein